MGDAGDILYGYLILVKMYSDLTKTPWDDIWEKGICEFLSVITFNIRYKREEEEHLKQWKLTH